jgi:hypothetical protein
LRRLIKFFLKCRFAYYGPGGGSQDGVKSYPLPSSIHKQLSIIINSSIDR